MVNKDIQKAKISGADDCHDMLPFIQFQVVQASRWAMCDRLIYIR